MKKSVITKVFFALLVTVFAKYTSAQQSVIKAAGPEYKRSPFYQSLWRHNYRREWATPISYPVFMLDTAYGGLVPYKEGGGNQSKSLHLKTKEGKEYVMRTINKRLRIVIPEIFHN